MESALDAVLQGLGIGYLYGEQVTDHLASDRLEQVLDEWLPMQPGFQLYYPNRQYMSSGLRAFIDHASALFRPPAPLQLRLSVAAQLLYQRFRHRRQAGKIPHTEYQLPARPVLDQRQTGNRQRLALLGHYSLR